MTAPTSDALTAETSGGLSDAEREVIRAKHAQQGMDSVILYVERIVAAREAAAANRGRAEAWDEGWQAARGIVELNGVKCWAHTVFPEGYEGNPYRADSPAGGER